MKVTFVDGYRIRNTTNTDFAAYATADHDPAIPKGEVWMEDYLKPEKDFFLRLIALEKKYYADGRAEARKQYGKKLTIEQKFRAEVKWFRKLRTVLRKEANARTDRPKTFALKTERAHGMNIVYVDGALVRQFLDPFFLMGGHYFIYDYIPKNEVWIDDRNHKDDQQFLVIHELIERKLMAKGMDYHSAHDYAIAEERYRRRKQGVAHFING